MNGSQPCQSIADQVREIPLLDLLHRHGFQTRPEGISLRARNDRYNIVVTGNRWFDNKAESEESGFNSIPVCQLAPNFVSPMLLVDTDSSGSTARGHCAFFSPTAALR
jgi:hypothetical protein